MVAGVLVAGREVAGLLVAGRQAGKASAKTTRLNANLFCFTDHSLVGDCQCSVLIGIAGVEELADFIGAQGAVVNAHFVNQTFEIAVSDAIRAGRATVFRPNG